ncbi:MAG: FG-GAP repeat protein, partial [Candidatus Omnitrophica bacterium]|nr:FG-GAP repeat protein [Candidatus Omnitrophota bacterium]
MPDSGSWTWGLELVRYGTGEHRVFATEPAAARGEGSKLTYEWSPALEEWFVNDDRGLEHGYTVHRRVGATPLELELRIRGGLEPRVSGDARDVRFVDGDGRTVVSYSGLTVFDATGKNVPARFDLVDLHLRLSIDDAAARYPLTIDPVVQQAYLKASNTDGGDTFGYSVAVDGDTAVIGAYGERSSATGVNGNESDNSLFSAGAAYVFVRSGSTWTQQAYLKASNTDSPDQFAFSVDVSGDTIVVGAPL